jgi:formylglycine-generating enzyme required for sulfatase activity/uncharacterized protein (DUF2235 family)
MMVDARNVGERKIILLSDGTGNAAGKLFKTNVWRLYEALDVYNANQIACYDDGVGTSSFKPLALLGGLCGWGLKRNVLNLYTFLCRNYREGDRIYGFGFSRGAFTIRVLINFILSQGLVADANSNDDLRRKALRLYRRFRIEKTRHWGLHLLARPIRDGAVFLSDSIFRGTDFRRIRTTKVPAIEFLGLWDTVDAYGLPIAELERAIDRWIWPLTIVDSRLHESVRKACHALAIDDERTPFHPVLWDESRVASDAKNHTDDEVLTQVWFAGVHANVGGGYPDDSLSSVTLQWMINEAQKKGLVFGRPALEALQTRVAPYGPIYNSRAGLGAYYRYGPRRLDPPVDRLGACIPNPKIHETVIWRMAAGTDSYAPLSLPNRLRIVVDDGLAMPGTAPGSQPVDAEPRRKNIYAFDNFLDAIKSDGNVFEGRGSEDNGMAWRRRAAKQFEALRKPDDLTIDLIWDTVWWRRVANYVTLLVTAYAAFRFYGLLTYPSDHPAPNWLESEARFAIGPFASLISGLLPRVIADPAQVLLRNVPATSAMLITIVVACVWWGKRVERRIRDRAIAGWNVNWHASRYDAFRASLRFRYTTAAFALIALLLVTTFFTLLWFGINVAVYHPNRLDSLPRTIKNLAEYFDPANDLQNFPDYDPNNDHERARFSYFLGMTAAILCTFLIAALIWAVGLYRVEKKARIQHAEVRGLSLWLANRLRTSRWLCASQRFIQQVAVPSALALGLVAAAIVVINPVGFAFMEAGGWVCKWPSVGRVANGWWSPDKTESVQLNTDTLCLDVDPSNWLRAGDHYKIVVTKVGDWSGVFHSAPPITQADTARITRPEEFKIWREADLEAASEMESSAQPPESPLLRILGLFRRVRSEPWFRVVAQIGPEGDDLYFLHQGFNSFTARRNGPLYLYVNHAVIGVPFLTSVFYARNKGTADITINPSSAPASAPPASVPSAPTAPALPAGPAQNPTAPTQIAGTIPLPPATERALKPKDTFQECANCPQMIVVPAGNFTMGSPASESVRSGDEGPQRNVTIRSFAVAKFEVTFDEWDACYAAGGCRSKPYDWGWGRGKRPAILVSWDDAQQYVKWLSKKTGQSYRLLTEAEYEFAARGGTKTAYPWGPDVGTGNANCNRCGSQWGGVQTAPVGSFPANQFGLYDMVGNVWEWTEDCWSDSYEAAPLDGSARTTGNCALRVLRGGSYNLLPRNVRSAVRNRGVTPTRSDHIGFRVARKLLAP